MQVLSSDHKVRCVSKEAEDYNAALHEGVYITLRENEKISGDFDKLIIKYTYKDMFDVAINELKSLRDNPFLNTKRPDKIGWKAKPTASKLL